jgi:hypothetical protein
MRLPFPERIPLPAAFIAATVLAGLQQLQGTNLNFSFYSFLFIIIATVAFNLAGGFTRASGSYVFFYAVLGVIVGISYKAFLGEPGESNLRSPILTMQVFTGGIISMLVAVILSRRLTRKKPFLGTMLRDSEARNAAIGCLVFGLIMYGLNVISTNNTSGSILSAINQLNRFLQMAVIIATLHTIRLSKGKTGVSGLVAATVIIPLLIGFTTFSKESMFTSILCWVIAACSLRLNVKPYQLGIGVTIVYFVFHFLVPYSQYGRDQVPENATFTQRIAVSVRLLSELDEVRRLYIEEQSNIEEIGAMGYYDQPQGFFDRLNMIGPDDALINHTSQDNDYAGLAIIPIDFANWIPHFLWPDKPLISQGNSFAHKIGGVVGEDDTTTGISFTPTGEAYHLAGWTGIFIVAPIIWTMLFTVFDSLCGDVRRSPWGLLVIALFAHVAPEGMLGGAIYVMWFGAVGIIVVALATSRVMPILGTLLAGPARTSTVSLRRPTMIAKSLRPRV